MVVGVAYGVVMIVRKLLLLIVVIVSHLFVMVGVAYIYDNLIVVIIDGGCTHSLSLLGLLMVMIVHLFAW